MPFIPKYNPNYPHEEYLRDGPEFKFHHEADEWLSAKLNQLYPGHWLVSGSQFIADSSLHERLGSHHGMKLGCILQTLTKKELLAVAVADTYLAMERAKTVHQKASYELAEYSILHPDEE